MLESEYQTMLIKRIKRRLPGALVLKNDTSHQQGIPDLTVLYLNHWAMLEVKAYEGAPEQPNQAYFVGVASAMSFGAFIYPENEKEVLDAIQQAFSTRRSSLLS
jgi:hypothetical protein